MLDVITGSSFVFSDGEHVTADEILGALTVAQTTPITVVDSEMRELWRSWLAFLQLSVEHDGIRVY